MKYNKYILHLSILIVLLISMTAISAADLNDTDNMNADVLKDDNTGDMSFMSLESDINFYESTFDMQQNYKFDNTSDLIYIGGVKVKNDNYVINGNNHVIDCGNQSRAFTITGNNVVINNLIIQNGHNTLGSAIKSTKNLILNNVTFINCSGNGTDNIGAVYVNSCKLTVKNCNFIDNTGKDGASISAFYSTVDITDSTFISKSENIIKGHIYLSESNLKMNYCDFLNTTSKYATAIFAEDNSKLEIANSRFKNLHANKTAGAIATKLIKGITISNCEFDNDSSDNNGGAIFIDVNGELQKKQLTARIEECTFNNCYSTFGGAILQLGGTLNLFNTNFTSNKAKYEGGAVYTSYAYVFIEDSKFESNTLTDNISYGGAAYFDMGNIFISGSTFINNLGHEVSTIYIYDTNMTLRNNYFNNPSNVTSMYGINGDVKSSKNNFNNDNYSFHNTNNNHNFENTANPFIILNNTIQYEELPEKFDLRTYGWVSPVKNQGFLGACWAFGNMAALESALMRYANASYSLAVNNVENTMLRYSKYGTTDNVEGGVILEGLKYMIDWLGIYPEEYDGYDELGKISSLFITPEDIHIQNVVAIHGRKDVQDIILEIKEALIKYGAVATTHNADFNEDKYYNPVYSAQYYNGKQKADHGITIVGWDDNYSANNFNPQNRPPGNGAWICKNSWGTDWGDNGYFYLSYYDTSFGQEGSVAYIINNDTYNRIYQLDVGGDIGYYEGGKFYLNVFTADEDELIAAVGTYFYNAGAKYELEIAVNDVPVHLQKGVSSFAGFETIKLNKYIQIKKNDTFSIMFKSNKVPVAMDYRIKALPKKSFVSEDKNAETWKDLKTSKAIAIIKAYTINDINITNNLIKYYTNDAPFVAKVGANETVVFEFGNKKYTIFADENGLAKLPIDSKVGKYNITTTYNNISIVNYITIKHTVISPNVKKTTNSNCKYKLRVVDSNGTGLKKTKVLITVNGKSAYYTSDNSGYITLKFTKLTKNQKITVKNPKTGDIKTSKIIVYSRFAGEKNVLMYYYDGSKFISYVLNDNCKQVGKNQVVTIKVNKKTYKVKTNSKGIIAFKIPSTLKPGKYVLSASYKGEITKKIIKVKQNLKTSKYTVKKSAKKLTVKAILKNGKKAVKNKKITLKLNGKKFIAKTNKIGIAKFTIKKNVISKLKAGKKYTMTFTYLKNTIKTTLKVKS